LAAALLGIMIFISVLTIHIRSLLAAAPHDRTAPSSEQLKLGCDGLISQYVDLAVQLQIARGVKLAHEDDDQV
jgi:hypothetical protein